MRREGLEIVEGRRRRADRLGRADRARRRDRRRVVDRAARARERRRVARGDLPRADLVGRRRAGRRRRRLVIDADPRRGPQDPLDPHDARPRARHARARARVHGADRACSSTRATSRTRRISASCSASAASPASSPRSPASSCDERDPLRHDPPDLPRDAELVRILGAKVVASFVAGLVFGILGTAVSFGIGYVCLSERDIPYALSSGDLPGSCSARSSARASGAASASASARSSGTRSAQ